MTSSPERIAKYIEQYEKEIKSIKDDLFKICWHMRGGVTYQEAVNLSSEERSSIGALIKENMETTKKTGLPYF